MQFYYKINDSHTRLITAIGYNNAKHEIVTGFEDGFVKFWEVDGGALVAAVKAHQGWVKGFVYWKTRRLLLSGSVDCSVAVWRGETVLTTVYAGSPVHSVAIALDSLLLLGTATGLMTIPLREDATQIGGGGLDTQHEIHFSHHNDIVSRIVVCDYKAASVGYDQRLVLYDCNAREGGSVTASVVVDGAHDAGINCLAGYRDTDDNVWFITGGFDKCVKVWNSGGKLVTRIDDFGCSIVDLTVVDRSGLVWVSNGGSVPWVLDARSGENMTSFTNSFRSIENERFRMQLIQYFPEVSMVVACTTRRHVLCWRAHSNAAVTRLMCRYPIDCITFSNKAPIMLICSVGNGQVIQWENRESNEGAYTMELVNMLRSMRSCEENKIQSRQFQSDPNHSRMRAQQRLEARKNKIGQRFLQMKYFDEKDLLIAASEDGIIYVFGYDVAAIEALMAVADNHAKPESLWKKTRFRMNIMTTRANPSPQESQTTASPRTVAGLDPVTMRITGLACKHVLIDHRSVVTGIAVVPPCHGRHEYFLISCSWDQRIVVWSLETFEPITRLICHPHKASYSGGEGCSVNSELAADDVITRIVYSEKLDQFAYSSGDFVLHIRRFSVSGVEMELLARITDHEAEITSILWLNSLDSWVTGSEDHSIRIWKVTTAGVECSQTINAGNVVGSLCCDESQGCLMASVGNDIKIFDMIEEHMIQVNTGHSGEIRELLLLQKKNQFVSVSEDGQILVWNNWIRPRKYVMTDM